MFNNNNTFLGLSGLTTGNKNIKLIKYKYINK